jgi:hypothetical protein
MVLTQTIGACEHWVMLAGIQRFPPSTAPTAQWQPGGHPVVSPIDGQIRPQVPFG